MCVGLTPQIHHRETLIRQRDFSDEAVGDRDNLPAYGYSRDYYQGTHDLNLNQDVPRKSVSDGFKGKFSKVPGSGSTNVATPDTCQKDPY